MIFKATHLISEAFDAHGIKYHINEMEKASVVEAGFLVEAGPEVIARFISTDDGNDVAVRIFGLMHKILEGKRIAVLEACNTLNARVRFVKFYLDNDFKVNVEADLPVQTEDSCIGECCFELFIRLMKILDSEYHILAEAVYSVPSKGNTETLELMKALQDLREKPLIIEKQEN